MTTSLPSFSGTQGSIGLEKVLESIREELLPELDALRSLFNEEVSPRAKRIGELLLRAQGNFSRNLDFYDWADTAVGLKQRQIRSYIRFSQRLAAIEAAAEDQGVPISSIEQGLALLAPAKEEDKRSEGEIKVAAVAQATGRALGAITRAMDAIYDLSPSGLSPAEVQLFQDLGDLLSRWGSTRSTTVEDSAADVVEVEPTPTTELAVDRQDEIKVEPTVVVVEPQESDNPDRQRLVGEGLPVDEKPSKWTLAQLEQALALCDDNGATLAKALGVSRASISANLKKKREAAGLTED